MNALSFDVPILFGAGGNHGLYAGEGWSSTDDSNTTWNDGHLCTLKFRVAALRQSVLMVLQASPYIVPGQVEEQELTVYLNGQFITYVRADDALTVVSAIDRDQLLTRTNTFSFVLPQAVSPRALGLGGDERKLGMAFIRLELSSAP